MTTISYLGPAGTFSDAALTRLVETKPHHSLSDEPQLLPMETQAHALDAVRDGTVDYACIPIENSVEGPIAPTFDALTQGSRVQIFAETELAVAFSILVRPGVTAKDVKTFASHPAGLTQVNSWREQHLPGTHVHATSSTVAAAHDVVSGRIDAAAAPARAGELLGLESLADGISEVPDAKTRFVLVGRPDKPTPRTGHDRTSVVFQLRNVPGSLFQALAELAIRGVDLTRIESRPTRLVFGTYNFYIDVVGHIDDPAIGEALSSLYRHSKMVRYLGSWPVSSGAGAKPPDHAPAERWLRMMKNGEIGS